MEVKDTVKILLLLRSWPWAISYLQSEYAEFVEDEGLFDLVSMRITVLAEQFLSQHQSVIAALNCT